MNSSVLRDGMVGDVREIGLVRAQGGDRGVDLALSDGLGVGGSGVPGRRERPRAPGREVLLLGQLAEHPRVRGVAAGVDGGEARDPVIGLVQPAVRLDLEVRGEHEVGAHLPDHAGDVPAQRQAVLEHPVGVVEMAQVLHTDLCAGAALLRLPQRRDDLGRLHHPGLAAGQQ